MSGRKILLSLILPLAELRQALVGQLNLRRNTGKDLVFLASEQQGAAKTGICSKNRR